MHTPIHTYMYMDTKIYTTCACTCSQPKTVTPVPKKTANPKMTHTHTHTHTLYNSTNTLICAHYTVLRCLLQPSKLKEARIAVGSVSPCPIGPIHLCIGKPSLPLNDLTHRSHYAASCWSCTGICNSAKHLCQALQNLLLFCKFFYNDTLLTDTCMHIFMIL